MCKPIKDLKRMPAGFSIQYPALSSNKFLCYHGAEIARINSAGYIAIRKMDALPYSYIYPTWFYSCKAILNMYLEALNEC